MNREALRYAWQLHDIFERHAEVHESHCVIPDQRRDEGHPPTVCPTCIADYHRLGGMHQALDLVNPGHDHRYRSDRLFWSDTEEPNFWRGTDVTEGYA
jgi:hypothetical protein